MQDIQACVKASQEFSRLPNVFRHKTIPVLRVCWAGAGSAEPFVLGREYPGLGIVGSDVPLTPCRQNTSLL